MRPNIEEIGSSSEEAIKSGLLKLGLPRDRVVVEVLGSKDSTPPGMSCVRITPLGDPPEPLKIAETLSTILEKMGIEASINLHIDENRILFELESPISGLIIGKNGMTIDALQHILNRIMNKSAESRWKILIDIEDYRKRKEINLISMAHQTAKKVKETGKSQELPPMNPHDRRIIHIELESDPKVTTESLGNGFLKNVLVSPVQLTRRNDRRR